MQPVSVSNTEGKQARETELRWIYEKRKMYPWVWDPESKRLKDDEPRNCRIGAWSSWSRSGSKSALHRHRRRKVHCAAVKVSAIELTALDESSPPVPWTMPACHGRGRGTSHHFPPSGMFRSVITGAHTDATAISSSLTIASLPRLGRLYRP